MAMPFEVDGDRSRQGERVEVCPSAVLELTWILGLLHWHREPTGLEGLLAAAPALREELVEVVGDDQGCLPDTSILAERIGALLTDEADTFLRGLERAARLDGVGLELRSETPEMREATLDRLERLRREPERARRYADLLTRVWNLVRPEWEEHGREAVLLACGEWTDRLRQGAEIVDLFPGKHVVSRSEQQALLSRRPRAVLSPMHFVKMGGFVVDMTAYLHVGGPARLTDVEHLRRKESEQIATRMKVLADGTRVALLRELALTPASVMDLARRFRLAQPTVSNHVRLLRDAGLLESQKDGTRILYSVPRGQLERLIDETRHLLIDH
jgi:DNA-binding transcriptional ArsR family regulator